MSWDAWLTDDRGHTEGSWNYTHNTNGMIEAVLGDQIAATPEPFWAALARTGAESQGREPVYGMGRGAWWDLLDGKSGPEGAALLDRIVKGLEADPERFQAMNPPNGWGDYDSLVRVLKDMRDRVPEWPCTWETGG